MREFTALLADLPIHLLTAHEAGVRAFPPETGETFAANARAKALHVTAETGLPALADDSGLVVDALGGAPGVYSARYGGPDADDADRNALLLDALRDIPPATRTARFVAVVAFSLPDGTVIDTEGRLEGAIADAPRGTNGFGYDPVFLVGDTGRTLAELTDDEKNGLSHRARALAALRPRLLAAAPGLEG
jgi:XTP/dITP diphosphohydrolase